MDVVFSKSSPHVTFSGHASFEDDAILQRQRVLVGSLKLGSSDVFACISSFASHSSSTFCVEHKVYVCVGVIPFLHSDLLFYF